MDNFNSSQDRDSIQIKENSILLDSLPVELFVCILTYLEDCHDFFHLNRFYEKLFLSSKFWKDLITLKIGKLIDSINIDSDNMLDIYYMVMNYMRVSRAYNKTISHIKNINDAVDKVIKDNYPDLDRNKLNKLYLKHKFDLMYKGICIPVLDSQKEFYKIYYNLVDKNIYHSFHEYMLNSSIIFRCLGDNSYAKVRLCEYILANKTIDMLRIYTNPFYSEINIYIAN